MKAIELKGTVIGNEIIIYYKGCYAHTILSKNLDEYEKKYNVKVSFN